MSRPFFSTVLSGFSLLLLLSPDGPAAEPMLNYEFGGDKNVLGDWALPPDLLAKVGDAITVEATDGGAVLKTRETNVRLIGGEENWGDYRVTLSGRIEYPCSFEVIGRYRSDGAPAYYFLRIDSSTKQIILGRFRNLKTEILQGTSLPPTFKFRDFVLALEFDGERIKGFVDGEMLVDQPDDGQITSGQVGIIGNFHTNLLLKSLTVSPAQPGTSAAPAASGGRRLVDVPTESAPTVDPVIPLSLKNWNLSDAYKKKAVFAKRIL
ncbi:MAG: hypothetical protein ACOYM3_15550 [Terrimicrobiaceae bacterium]